MYVCIYSFSAAIFIIKIGQFMKIGLCSHWNIHENKSVVFFYSVFFSLILFATEFFLILHNISFLVFFISFQFGFSLILVQVLFLSLSCSPSFSSCVRVYVRMRVGESECYIKIFLSIQLWIHVKLFASFPSGERSVCDCLIFNCVHTKIKTEFTRASKRDFIKYEKKNSHRKKLVILWS